MDVNALTLLAGQTVPEPLLRATEATPSASLFKDLPVGLPSELARRS